jgi:hypothetical protein
MALRARAGICFGVVCLTAAGTPLACDELLGLRDPVTVPDDAFDEGRGSEPDEGTADAKDVGYPAFHPSPPQMVTKNPGATLPMPTAQAVLFNGDSPTTYQTVESAVSAWVSSGIWQRQLQEYDIPRVTLASPITAMDASPNTLSDDQIQDFLKAQVAATELAVDEVFVLFFPPSSTIHVDGGTSCTDFSAYHSDFTLGTTIVTYAVIPNCGGSVADLTKASTMIGIATVTNPRPSRPGYATFDPDHLAWNYLHTGKTTTADSGVPMTELPQPCAGETYPLPDSGLPIARSWSNDAMAGYHDPCVPATGDASYFVSVPVMNDKVTLQGTYPTAGVSIEAGATRNIEVDLLSDGPTSGPWKVEARVLPPFEHDSLTFSFDRSGGVNGDRLRLSITATGSEPVAFEVVSTLGARHTTWVGLVGP